MKPFFHIVLVMSLSIPLLQCTTGEDSAPAPVISILQPKAGATFKLTDTVRVITESDYTRFTSGITFNFSADSSKTWLLIKSLVRKEGREKDTLLWVPAEDSPGEVVPGRQVRIQVYDYSKKYETKSGYITFTN